MEIGKIEKNIPIDVPRGRRAHYPFGKMDVGDSFMVSCSKDERKKICSAVSYYGKRNQKKFSVGE